MILFIHIHAHALNRHRAIATTVPVAPDVNVANRSEQVGWLCGCDND
jgi:hypothetical protein